MGSFQLLTIDCLLEKTWLDLSRSELERAKETLATSRKLIEDHGYHCKDAELQHLEREWERAVRLSDRRAPRRSDIGG